MLKKIPKEFPNQLQLAGVSRYTSATQWRNSGGSGGDVTGVNYLHSSRHAAAAVLWLSLVGRSAGMSLEALTGCKSSRYSQGAAAMT